jgi:hypothetical protein
MTTKDDKRQGTWSTGRGAEHATEAATFWRGDPSRNAETEMGTTRAGHQRFRW